MPPRPFRLFMHRLRLQTSRIRFHSSPVVEAGEIRAVSQRSSSTPWFDRRPPRRSHAFTPKELTIYRTVLPTETCTPRRPKSLRLIQLGPLIFSRAVYVPTATWLLVTAADEHAFHIATHHPPRYRVETIGPRPLTQAVQSQGGTAIKPGHRAGL
jgi:hypothetical protein